MDFAGGDIGAGSEWVAPTGVSAEQLESERHVQRLRNAARAEGNGGELLRAGRNGDPGQSERETKLARPIVIDLGPTGQERGPIDLWIGQRFGIVAQRNGGRAYFAATI